MLPSSVMYSAALAYMGEAMLSLLTEHGLIVLVMSHANSTADFQIVFRWNKLENLSCPQILAAVSRSDDKLYQVQAS